MQHPLRQARQAAQAGGLVQVAHQRPHAQGAQFVDPRGVRGQGQHLHAWRQAPRHAQADIATANDQDPLATEARGQGAQRCLV